MIGTGVSMHTSQQHCRLCLCFAHGRGRRAGDCTLRRPLSQEDGGVGLTSKIRRLSAILNA
jgi:hypothetical protein